MRYLLHLMAPLMIVKWNGSPLAQYFYLVGQAVLYLYICGIKQIKYPIIGQRLFLLSLSRRNSYHSNGIPCQKHP